MFKKSIFIKKNVTIKEDDLLTLLFIMYCVGVGDKEGKKFVCSDNIKEWLKDDTDYPVLKKEAIRIIENCKFNKTDDQNRIENIEDKINLLFREVERLEYRIITHDKSITAMEGIVYEP